MNHVTWPQALSDLGAAAERGDAAAVQALLSTSANAHARFDSGTTALYLAAKGGQAGAVRNLSLTPPPPLFTFPTWPPLT